MFIYDDLVIQNANVSGSPFDGLFRKRRKSKFLQLFPIQKESALKRVIRGENLSRYPEHTLLIRPQMSTVTPISVDRCRYSF
jgi:hypothetical protein